MKKILVALAMSVVMFTSSIALAAFEETIRLPELQQNGG